MTSVEATSAAPPAGAVDHGAVAPAARPGARRPSFATRLVGEQVLVLAGQLAAGVSHLAFAVVVARLLSPDQFAAFAAFQALYLITRAVANSLTAGGALDPAWTRKSRGEIARVGVGLGVAGALGSVLIGSLLGLPAVLVWLLAASIPGAALFALDQGRLYGSLRHGRAVAGQIAGPALRMAVGIPLAIGAGASGAALATVVGGYVSMLVAWPWKSERTGAGAQPPAASPSTDTPETPAPDGRARTGVGSVPAVISTFLVLAVVQNLDVTLANRFLEGTEPGRFAALSTLAGAVAFATATVPFVLLPRARDGGGLLPALLVSGTLGFVPVLVVTAVPGPVLTAVVGDRYADAAPWAARYVAAIALLGVARVLAAYLCAGERWRRLPLLAVTLAVATQAIGIIGFAGGAGGVANATLAATSLLTAIMFVPAVVTGTRSRRTRDDAPVTIAPAAASETLAIRVRHRLSPARVVAGLTVAGFLVRLLSAGRSVWVDEAISVSQARLPFREMLDSLSTGDVHPPLHNALLWVSMRLFGNSELAIRAPSILAGTLMIPMLYAAGKAIHGRRAGMVAAALGTVSPFMVWYSQEARMYGMVMLFALVALWAQVRVLDGGHWWHWIPYVVASAAMVWTHYFALVPLAIQQLIFVWEWWRRRRTPGWGRDVLRWIGAGAWIVALLVPLMFVLQNQLETNKAVGRIASGTDVAQTGASTTGVSIYRIAANIIWALWGFHPDDVMTRIAALWPLLMLLALFLLGRGWSRRDQWLVSMTVLPAAAFLIIGYWRDNLFEIRYFAAAVAPLLLLCASWIVRSMRTAIGVAVATCVLMATMAMGLVDQQVNKENPRVYDFDAALANVERLIEPGDAFVYGPDFLSTVVDYYAPGVEAHSVREASRSLADGHRVVVLGSFLDQPEVAGQLGAVLSRLDNEGDRVETIQNGVGVRIWVFE